MPPATYNLHTTTFHLWKKSAWQNKKCLAAALPRYRIFCTPANGVATLQYWYQQQQGMSSWNTGEVSLVIPPLVSIQQQCQKAWTFYPFQSSNISICKTALLSNMLRCARIGAYLMSHLMRWRRRTWCLWSGVWTRSPGSFSPLSQGLLTRLSRSSWGVCQ